MSPPTLTLRHLGRATLERQRLLSRADLSLTEAVHRLLGLQAQLARPPFVGLWARLKDFDLDALKAAIHNQEIVRVTAMRSTLHLLTAEDYVALRPSFQPALEGAVEGILKARKAELDRQRWADLGEALYREAPRTMTELRDHALGLEPDVDERAVGYLVRNAVPLLQVPNQSQWAYPNIPTFAHAEVALGRAIPREAASPAPLIRAYLRAFGPSPVADMQAFTGLAGLADALTQMGDALRVYRSEDGQEIYDLAGLTLPDADTPAPPRFLPDFDSVMIGRGDARILATAHRKAVYRPGLRVLPTFLLDGCVAGTWTTDYKAKVATLTLSPLRALTKAELKRLEPEGDALLKLLYEKAKSTTIEVEGVP